MYTVLYVLYGCILCVHIHNTHLIGIGGMDKSVLVVGNEHCNSMLVIGLSCWLICTVFV